MKRIVSILLLAVMLLSTFALVSCNPLKGAVEINIRADKVWEEIKGWFGYEIPRYTITAEEWQRNMHLKNYTLRLGELVGMKRTETAYYEGEDWFFVFEDGVEYCLTKEGRKWTATVSDWGYINAGLFEDLGVPTDISFNELKFDEATGTYSCRYEDEEWGDVYYFIFRFKNGVIDMVGGGDEEEMGLALNVTDVGTTHIEIPEFTIVDENP